MFNKTRNHHVPNLGFHSQIEINFDIFYNRFCNSVLIVVSLSCNTFILTSTFFINLNPFVIKVISLNDFKYFDKLAMSVFDYGVISSFLHLIYSF